MAWAKLDDGLPEHPKILEAGPIASWVYICAIVHSSRYLTDGLITDEVAEHLRLRVAYWTDFLPETPNPIDELVRLHLFDRVTGGYMIHDYHDYNPRKEQVKATREHNRARQARFRNALLTGSRPVPSPPVHKERRKRFVAPTVEEVRAYCAERAYHFDPNRFVNHYQSKGWKVGKDPMVDWKAACRTWESTWKDQNGVTESVNRTRVSKAEVEAILAKSEGISKPIEAPGAKVPGAEFPDWPSKRGVGGR